MKSWWKDLSVSKKLYTVVGVMALLILIELFTLYFAMSILSSVRAFVAGEGLWSKSQKMALHNIQKYIDTGDDFYFQQYMRNIEVPLGDKIARLELEKVDFDESIARQGLIQGKNHPDDVSKMIWLMRNFHDTEHLKEAIQQWQMGDLIFQKMLNVADKVREQYSSGLGLSTEEKRDYIRTLDNIDEQLTLVEDKFSSVLGQASRKLEKDLMIALVFVVFMVESTGLFLTIRFAMRLTQSLEEMNKVTAKVGAGDFSQRINVSSRDELGRLGESINQMIKNLNMQIEGRISAEKMQSVVNTIADGVIMLNEDLTIESWNPSAKRIFGYSADDAIGKDLGFLITRPYHNQNKYFLKNFIRNNATNDKNTTRELRGKRKDGTDFPMEFVVSELNIGNRTYYTALARDITGRRKAEEELLKTKAAAEIANTAKSAFLANMSHEIRTPLGVILGFADFLASTDISKQERTEYAEKIKRNGELLTNVINDILDISKIEAGKLEITKQNVQLEELLDDIYALLSLKAEEKGLDFSIKCDINVPRSINTDPLRLKQILVNVIGNAIKFTLSGSVTVLVKSDRSILGENIYFYVSDTGIGISMEDVNAKIFKTFSQADASINRRFGGTGLGLALSKKLANILGGDIVLERSILGKGSTFLIKIQSDRVINTEVISRKNELSSFSKYTEDDNFSLKNISILLADDSSDNQLLVSKYLEKQGADVALAENGKVAVDKALQNKYDVILMDIQMPVMDGYQATHELRKKGITSPIIALTAHAFNEDKLRCFDAGFDEHVTKPINRKLLLGKIGHLLNKETS